MDRRDLGCCYRRYHHVIEADQLDILRHPLAHLCTNLDHLRSDQITAGKNSIHVRELLQCPADKVFIMHGAVLQSVAHQYAVRNSCLFTDIGKSIRTPVRRHVLTGDAAEMQKILTAAFNQMLCCQLAALIVVTLYGNRIIVPSPLQIHDWDVHFAKFPCLNIFAAQHNARHTV